jgi:signal transduction histidine kinase
MNNRSQPEPLRERFVAVIRSIRFRLALWFVFVLAIVMFIYSAFIFTRQARESRVAAVSRLEAQTRRLAAVLRGPGRAFDYRLPSANPGDPFSESLFLNQADIIAFASAEGQVTQSMGPADAAEINRLIETGLNSPAAQGDALGRFFIAPLPGVIPRTNYVYNLTPLFYNNLLSGYFLLGAPIDPDRQLPRLLVSLSLGMLLILLIALVGGFWIADRAMRPVKQITQAAQSISETDLSLRLRLHQKDEIGELADTFDEMIARLQAAFERQRQFTADASHELRTPLTIVELEASRALAATRSPQEYHRVLKVIQSENQFMTRLVTNLLTMARMDAGQVVLEKQVHDLSLIVSETVERLAPLAKKYAVRLTIGELPELPILGDRQYLLQMLNNLVENAIKYVEGDPKTVVIASGSRNAGAGQIAWARIRDNGLGIAPEHLPRLFDRFYQVDKARTHRSTDEATPDETALSGTGLGLSIALWIVQAHGGQILVESEPGKGSTFEVSLPLAPHSSPKET